MRAGVRLERRPFVGGRRTPYGQRERPGDLLGQAAGGLDAPGQVLNVNADAAAAALAAALGAAKLVILTDIAGKLGPALGWKPAG